MSDLIYSLVFFNLVFSLVSSESPTVIIIGAGPAGIAAATKLLENSITKVTVFEAENRIGGRVHSVKFGEGYVDIGAEYVHGEEGNVVYQTVKDLNLLEHSIQFTQETIQIYDSKGFQVDQNLSKDLIEIISNYGNEDLKSEDIDRSTMGEVFLQAYNKTILEKYKNDENNLKTAEDAIKLMENIVIMHEGSFNWHQVSARPHYTACPGDQQMTWKTGGYSSIFNVLMKNHPNLNGASIEIKDKITLNKKVTKIHWNNNPVLVQLSDNSSLQADYVIFTPSIGVLKHQKDTLFEPKLPQEKLKALEALGISGIMKVDLHFPEKWWNNKTKIFEFLWNSNDLQNIKKEFSEGPEKNGSSWVTHISALVKVPSNENVFVAWLSGELLPELEQIPEEIILKGCNYVIKKFLGKNYNIVEADKMIRSQWITNPNFLGTYSYEKVGFSKEISYQTELTKPLINPSGNPVVLFAGEATHPTLYSTVHGAIETGRREADRIINIYRKNQ